MPYFKGCVVMLSVLSMSLSYLLEVSWTGTQTPMDSSIAPRSHHQCGALVVRPDLLKGTFLTNNADWCNGMVAQNKIDSFTSQLKLRFKTVHHFQASSYTDGTKKKKVKDAMYQCWRMDTTIVFYFTIFVPGRALQRERETKEAT